MAEEAVPAPAPELTERLPEPDKAAHQAKVAAIQEQIAKKQERMQAIRDSIEIQSNARKAGREAQSGPRGELQAIRKERKAKIEEKKAIREQLNTMKRVDLPGKRDRPKMSVASVDERIQRLAQRQSTESLTMKEEKQIMDEIKALKASRKGIQDYDQQINGMKAKRETQELKRSELITVLKDLDKEIDGLTEQKEALEAKLEKEGPKKDSIGELIAERDELRPEISKLYDEMRALRDAYKKENDIWWESEKVWRVKDREERQKKYEEQRKKKLVEDELYRQQREAEEIARGPEDPFVEEKIFCENLIEYLESISGPKEASTVEKKAIDHGDMQVLSKKNNDEEQESWGGLAKAKKKKKKKGSQGPKTSKVMQHPAPRVGAFHEIGLEPPTSADQIPGLIDTLKAKIAEYTEKAASAPKKVRKASRPHKVALRIQSRGEDALKVIIDVIPGN